MKESGRKMYLIAWNSRYSIGIQEIDEHHRHLVFLLNKIYEVFVNETPGWDLAVIFDALTDYTQYHFSAEEALMQEYRYPDITLHKMRHDQFVRRLESLKENFNSGKHHLSFELLTFLNTWFLSHILDADAALGKFLAPRERMFLPDHETVNRRIPLQVPRTR